MPEQRLRRGSFYVLQMRDGKYLVGFKMIMDEVFKEKEGVLNETEY